MTGGSHPELEDWCSFSTYCTCTVRVRVGIDLATGIIVLHRVDILFDMHLRLYCESLHLIIEASYETVHNTVPGTVSVAGNPQQPCIVVLDQAPTVNVIS